MAHQLTFGIVKPDAFRKNVVGRVLACIEGSGLHIVAMRQCRLSRREAEGFYAEHRGRPFFDELVSFMTSGPVALLALSGENAVARYRDLMGATDPAKAAEGTIRREFSDSIGENTVHGSDGDASAARELAYFFPSSELAA
ncbi:MAG: nucleoside-diphosphate kinase [Rickettsiales bacterium]